MKEDTFGKIVVIERALALGKNDFFYKCVHPHVSNLKKGLNF